MSTESPVVLLMGSQGSGKGTQGSLMRERLGFHVFEMGNMLRQEAENNSELAAILEKGELAPDALKVEILHKAFLELPENTLIAFDGYPRTQGDLSGFEELMRVNNKSNIKVVHLFIEDELAISRIENRKTCSACGRIFNEPSLETCSFCGGKLQKRSDEYAEATKKRLSWHHEIVIPVIKALMKKYDSLEVDGSLEVEEVYNQVITFINDHKD